MKNISIIDGKYWRVKVERQGIRYSVLIPFNGDKSGSLQRAIAERERFYAAHGATSPRSNTGISGISETFKYVRNHRYDCFQVTVGDSRKSHPRRFTYRGLADRESVLRAAIAWRTRHTGEDAAQLLAQAREAFLFVSEQIQGDERKMTIREHGSTREIQFSIAVQPGAKVRIQLGGQTIHITPFALLLAAQTMQTASVKDN